MSKNETLPLVVGVSGASGVVYGLRVLDACRELGVETHLVISRSAALTLAQETTLTLAQAQAKATVAHKPGEIGASIASGSFRTLGMVVAPCSVRTMSEIASGVTSTLLTRAADVTLKERRPLVLMVRETPLHLGHLRTMVRLAEMGAVIAPPLPAFYAMPASLEDMVDQSVGRALDLFGLSWRAVRRWGDDLAPLQGEG
jgi:4-hydroxy-3-polyprenylbenzoate decarboxylase